MYKCHLVIEGSLQEIQDIMGLLTNVKDHVKHVGPVPKSVTDEILEPFEKTKELATNPVPIDGRIEYKHCMTCGIQYVPVPKQKKPFCSKSCYMKDWFDRHKSKPVVNQAPLLELPAETIQAEIEPAHIPAKKSSTRKKKSEMLELLSDNLKPTRGKKFLPEKHYIQKDNFGGLY